MTARAGGDAHHNQAPFSRFKGPSVYNIKCPRRRGVKEDLDMADVSPGELRTRLAKGSGSKDQCHG